MQGLAGLIRWAGKMKLLAVLIKPVNWCGVM